MGLGADTSGAATTTLPVALTLPVVAARAFRRFARQLQRAVVVRLGATTLAVALALPVIATLSFRCFAGG